MTKPNSTEVIVIVDRSGSMHPIARDMEGGFATFLDEQRKTPGECRLTLVKFDDQYERVCIACPLSQVPPLKIEPRGGTALLDAIGRTIHEAGQRFAAMPAKDRPGRVVVVTITDGEENSSQVYNHGQVMLMIKHQRERYSWDFVYLGANVDAIKVAAHLGIGKALTYTPDSASVGAMFSAASNDVVKTRGGLTSTSGDLVAKYKSDGGK